MANICDYDLKVKGKLEDIKTFYKWFEYDDENEKPEQIIGYGYDVYNYDSELESENDLDSETIIEFSGVCKWSVSNCMLKDSGYTHNTEAIGLEGASKLLNLKIELFSKEEGLCFSEHYLIENGELLIDGTTTYKDAFICGLDDFNTYEEYTEYCKDEYGENYNLEEDCFTEDEFNKYKNDDQTEFCDYFDENGEWKWELK